MTLLPFGVPRAVFVSLFRVPRAFRIPYLVSSEDLDLFGVPRRFRVPFLCPQLYFLVSQMLYLVVPLHIVFFSACPSIIMAGTLIFALKLFYFAFMIFAAFVP